jgi:hypothetical protein
MATPGELRITSYVVFAISAVVIGSFLFAGSTLLASWASLLGGVAVAAIRFAAVWKEEHRQQPVATGVDLSEIRNYMREDASSLPPGQEPDPRDLAELQYTIEKLLEQYETSQLRDQSEPEHNDDSEGANQHAGNEDVEEREARDRDREMDKE